MGSNIKYTKEEFDSTINRIESINDIKERLIYIDSVRMQFSEIFFPKKGVRLLSSAHYKIIDDFKKRLNRLTDEIENRLRAADHKSEDETRGIDDYLQWNGNLKQLRYLIKELIKYGYIIEKSENIDKLISEHFIGKDFTDVVDKKVKRIKWGKYIPDLLHLFETLSANNLLDHFLMKRHHNIAPHFSNRIDAFMKPDDLRKKYSEYINKKDYKTDRFEQLDNIIKEITSTTIDDY